jgi:hypothetical protein
MRCKNREKSLLAIPTDTPPLSPQLYNEASRNIDNLLSQKSKLIVFLFVPLAAINSWCLFRKIRLNLLEHAILAGMILLGMLLL